MPQPLIAGFPANIELPAGYVIRVTALDPVAGSVVSGVTVSDVSVLAHDLVGEPAAEPPLPFLVPSDSLG